jgi:hypothetical protein
MRAIHVVGGSITYHGLEAREATGDVVQTGILHDLSTGERDAYTRLMQPAGSVIVPALNHHINSIGELRGFTHTMDASVSAEMLPVSRCVGSRNSAVECTDCSQQILRLLMDQETVKQRLLALVQRMHRDSYQDELSFRCMPERSSSGMSSMIDAMDWSVEPPTTLGIYHAYAKSKPGEPRTHRLFIAATGCCNRLAEAFHNLTVDTRSAVTAGEVVASYEHAYLSHTSQRNMSRILQMTAAEMDLRVPTKQDLRSCVDHRFLATCTVDSVTSSIASDRDRVTVCESVVNHTRSKNGVLFAHHPSDGLQLFKGRHCARQAQMPYGDAFGHSEQLGYFPSSVTQVHRNYSHVRADESGHVEALEIVRPVASSAIVYTDIHGDEIAPSMVQYTTVSDRYTRALVDLGWCADYGVVDLMPIAVIAMCVSEV